MKKNIKIIVFALPLMLLGFQMKSQYIDIPDVKFRTYLKGRTDLKDCFNSAEQLDTTCAGLLKIYSISITNSTLKSIEGIQYFKELLQLNIYSNFVTEIPQLPNKIQYLNIFKNKIKNMKNIPDSLVSFSCFANDLTKLPKLNGKLRELLCMNNSLTELPQLPNSLLGINANYNKITIFPKLPNQIRHITCSDNQLTSFPNLPNSLEDLTLSNNMIEELPNLSKSLKKLNCSNNYIKVIGAIPDSLESLSCKKNKLTELPNFSSVFKYLDCSNNNLMCLPLLPKTLTSLNISQTSITCLPNKPVGLSSSLPVCTTPCLTGIKEENSLNESVNLYPNPVSETLNITFSSSEIQSAVVQITNTQGQIIASQKIQNNSTIETATWMKGIYFVKISTPKGNAIQKIVKD